MSIQEKERPASQEQNAPSDTNMDQDHNLIESHRLLQKFPLIGISFETFMPHVFAIVKAPLTLSETVIMTSHI